MGAKDVSKIGGTSGTPDRRELLTRLQSELEGVLSRIRQGEEEEDRHRSAINALIDRRYALWAERDAIRTQIACLGGGYDGDYYHRRRERAVAQIVQHGMHPVVEDGA